MGFSQFRPNPTISSEKKKAYFRKNPVFGGNFPVSGEIFQFPARIFSFRRKFQIPATLILQISMPFLIPAPDPTRPTLTMTENRTDRFFRRSVSGYSAPPPDAGGSSPGWVENRPGPTRGQPYLWHFHKFIFSFCSCGSLFHDCKFCSMTEIVQDFVTCTHVHVC